jgi:hypothetical protein
MNGDYRLYFHRQQIQKVRDDIKSLDKPGGIG